MEVLAIGNSFSRDGTRYLHGIAKADGKMINVVGLAIGGCSLALHYKHFMADDPLYELWINGEYTSFFVTMKEALLNRDWDVITIQEATFSAYDYENYQPFLNELVALFKKYCPKAKIAIHETWMPVSDNAKLKAHNFKDSFDMYNAIHAAYAQAIAEVKPDVVIPSAPTVCRLLAEGFERFHDVDGHHASLGEGRYALGLVWYKALTGRSVTGNTFRDFDVDVSEENVAYLQRIVDDVIDLSKN